MKEEPVPTLVVESAAGDQFVVSDVVEYGMGFRMFGDKTSYALVRLVGFPAQPIRLPLGRFKIVKGWWV